MGRFYRGGFSHCSRNLRCFACLYILLALCGELVARELPALQDAQSDSNSDTQNVNIDQLISLSGIISDALSLSFDLNGNGQSVVKHRISHRVSTGPVRMEIDPGNARLLNHTAKKILAKMMSLLVASFPIPPTFPEDSKTGSVRKSCSMSCHNGGTCILGNGTNACSCLAGFRGEFCEFLDDCNGVQGCGSFASCINDRGHFRCRCRDGFFWSEKGCIDGGLCRGVTCQNGGTCLPLPFSTKFDSPKKFICRCERGFVGEFCEKVSPTCFENRCDKDEVCIADANGSYCVSQDAAIRYMHRRRTPINRQLLWISLLVMVVIALIAPLVIFLMLCRHFEAEQIKNSIAKVRISHHNKLKASLKKWFGKCSQSGGRASLQESISEDDQEIQDGAGQIV